MNDVAAADGPEIAPVRPGEELDRNALEAWLRPRLSQALPGADGPLEILQFPNGSANLTYLLRFGAHELVLRRPPFGPGRPRRPRHAARAQGPLPALASLRPGAARVPVLRRPGRARRRLLRDGAPARARSSARRFRRRCGSPRRRPPHRARPRRRHGRAAPARPGGVRARRPRPARRLRRAPGRRVGASDGGSPGPTTRRPRWTTCTPASRAACRRRRRVSIVHNDLKLDNCQFEPGEPGSGACRSSTGT